MTKEPRTDAMAIAENGVEPLASEDLIQSLTSTALDVRVPALVDNASVGSPEPSSPSQRRKRGTYKNYSEAQIKNLVNGYVCECLTITEAAKRAGINRATASRMLKKLNEDEHHRLPLKKQRGRTAPPALDQDHTNCIIRHVDKHPNATLEDILGELSSAYPNLSISKNALALHIKNTCYFAIERAEEIERQDTHEVRLCRKESVLSWRSNPTFDFEQTCVFIGESVFQFHILRGFARSRKSGEPARVAQPATQPRRHLPVFGAIASEGVIDISVVFTPGSANWEHFMAYLDEVMNVLDRGGLHNRHLVFDSVSMITTDIKLRVEQRGYQCSWIPASSPFLSPVQDFFSRLSTLVNRKPLEPSERLVSRILQAAEQITATDIQGWINTATTYFDRCLQEEQGL